MHKKHVFFVDVFFSMFFFSFFSKTCFFRFFPKCFLFRFFSWKLKKTWRFFSKTRFLFWKKHKYSNICWWTIQYTIQYNYLLHVMTTCERRMKYPNEVLLLWQYWNIRKENSERSNAHTGNSIIFTWRYRPMSQESSQTAFRVRSVYKILPTQACWHSGRTSAYGSLCWQP